MRKIIKVCTAPQLSRVQHYHLIQSFVRGLFFPRRCPFCMRVIGFLPECDSNTCQAQQATQCRAVKYLVPEEHYLGDLEGAAAAYQYADCARDAILHLKFHQMYSAGHTLGNLMAKELFGCTFLRKYGIVIPVKMQTPAQYHIIVPVPPSDGTRGYNVPTLFARQLQYALGVPLCAGALARIRFTKKQARLPFAERFANVAGAFATSPNLDLTGKRVLLVDDVITTGATVCACAQALYHAGAESVFAVSFAVALHSQHDETQTLKGN